jgi:hypothetical protein
VPRPPKQIDLEDLIAETAGDVSVAASKIKKREPTPPTPKRVTPPFERHRAQLPAELEMAARQVLRDYLLAQVGPRVTTSYKPPEARGGKPRDMGSDVRDAKATIELIRAQLGDDVMRDVEWFIAAVVTRADGTPMRFADSGAMIAPGKSAEAQRWAGYGALARTLSVLARFYSRQRALGKLGESASQDDKDNLKQLLSTLAERRKNRIS